MEAAKTPCDCQAAGFCQRHQFTTTQREWELCRTKQEWFDLFSNPDCPQKFRENGEQAPPPTPPTPEQFPCIYRGEKLSELECKPCGGKRILDVFDCSKYEKCTVGSSNLPSSANPPRVCISCDDRREALIRRVIIRDNLCPGDIAVLTAALRELHSQYPRQFETDVRVNHRKLFDGSPFITPLEDNAEGVETIEAHYDTGDFATINQSNQRPIHMLEAYCEGLSKTLSLPDPLRPVLWLEPSIWLTSEEKGWLPQVQELTGRPPRYWIVNAGAKADYTAKLWPYYQQVIDQTPSTTWVQVGQLEHSHEPLKGPNVINLIGDTDLRQLVRLVYHADGILCGVTALAHLAHWVERKPGVFRQAVVIAGGREAPHWFTYPRQQVMHTIGQFDCCEHGGCWKSRAVALPEFPEHNARLCTHPVNGVPLCMRSITPERVASMIQQLTM